MTKHMKLGVVVLLLGIGTMPLRAQEQAHDKASTKPTLSASQAVLLQWNDIGRKLIAMAEDFPEDKFDYKPHPDSRTFATNLLHAAASMYYFTDPAQGQKPRYPDDPNRDALKTKAQIVEFVKKAVADGATVIKAKGDKSADEIVDDGGRQRWRLYDLAYGIIEHSGEHYGQLVVYYRNNGMVPPESRPRK
ncbi:MAG TPA: DinB family protein [Candidatus Acidoferrales bacterium]|nr:DinB family protein [Candidatus Acidoferrales bacterium]